MLEKEIEKAVVDHAKTLGFLAYKFTSPGNRGVPDRLFLAPGGCFFMEFKTPKGELSPQQKEQIKAIRDLGHDVYIVDDIDSGVNLLDNYIPEDDHGDDNVTLNQVDQIASFFISELNEEDGDFIEQIMLAREFTAGERVKVLDIVDRYGFEISPSPWSNWE